MMDAQEFNNQEIDRHRLDRSQVAHLLELGARAVQRANDLVVDGMAGPKTRARIPGATDLSRAGASDAAALVYNEREIAGGSLSAEQQAFLVEAGARVVQQVSGLVVDGKAGPRTREALAALEQERPTVRGIDVSFYQADIDWQAVATRFPFAFVRASQGDAKLDSHFAQNWAGARAAGVIRGAYHFLEAAPDPVAQARHFTDAIARAGGLAAGDLPPALDVEPRGHEYPSLRTVRACLDAIERSLGRTPIIYIQGWFYQSVLGAPRELRRYPLWIAGHYHTYDGWAPSFWQYGFDEAVPGVAGKVDADRFEGTLEQLRQLTGGGAPR